MHKVMFQAFFTLLFQKKKEALTSQVALVVKNPPANAGDLRAVILIPGLGISPGGNGNPLQYSCLENPIRGAWQFTIHSVAQSQI